MKQLTKQLKEILDKDIVLRTLSEQNKERLIHKFIETVKERDIYCVGEDEDEDIITKKNARVYFIEGENSARQGIRYLQEKTL